MIKRILSLFALLTLHAAAADPVRFPLWPGGAPGALGTAEKDQPTLDLYKPDNVPANGCAVIVCPGGGYGGLAKDHEGVQPARFFNSFGVTAYVLHYRLGADQYRHPVPLQDAQRALRLVRSRAAADGIDPARLGLMGFSAGGHLAATAGTRHDPGNPEAADPADRLSSRPDFLILCYGVLSFDAEITHQGSVQNLLGDKKDDPALRRLLSNELQVNASTPPSFLFHTAADQAVPDANSLRFYEACRRHQVPAALHVYQEGRHGVGLAQDDPDLKTWPGLLRNWITRSGWLAAK